jgi:hypothetical protein
MGFRRCPSRLSRTKHQAHRIARRNLVFETLEHRALLSSIAAIASDQHTPVPVASSPPSVVMHGELAPNSYSLVLLRHAVA